MPNKGYYSPHLKITAISLNCPNSLNVQPLFHCLHNALFHCILLVYPVLLPGLQYKLALRPHLFNGQGHHVTVAVTLQPKVSSHRFLGLSMTRLGYCSYMFTKSLTNWSCCASYVLWSLARTPTWEHSPVSFLQLTE